MQQGLAAGWRPQWLPFLAPGDAQAFSATSPTPILYGNVGATLFGGGTSFGMFTDEQQVPFLLNLYDSPPAGTASALNLTGASVTLLVRQVGAAAVLFTRAALVNTATSAGYTFTAGDIAQMPAGDYTATMLVQFTSGEVREFGTISITMREPGQ